MSKITDKTLLEHYYVTDDLDENRKVFQNFECSHCGNLFKNLHATNGRAHLSTIEFARQIHCKTLIKGT